MSQVIYFNFLDASVKYKFINRNKEDKFPRGFDKRLRKEIRHLATLRLTQYEKDWLLKQNSIYPEFVDWFEKYRFNPKEVKVKLVKGDLQVEIEGSWLRTIFWEVPLLAIISELYYKMLGCTTDWPYVNKMMRGKRVKLAFPFADFGTRRRFSYDVQDRLVKTMKAVLYEDGQDQITNLHFLGTSNPHFAMKYRVTPIGTYAHEAPMFMQVFGCIEASNNHWLTLWRELYGKQYSIMLTDTLTTDYFLDHMPGKFFRMMDGVRLDSGDPIKVGQKVLNFYKAQGIDPKHKKFVWSDNLNPETAKKIYGQFKDKTNCIFGIGTNLTNDCGQKPLNMVIKLDMVNGQYVVKLSDDKGKHTGNPVIIARVKETIKRIG
jgi:nicotinate phosphoribosyltransferase